MAAETPGPERGWRQPAVITAALLSVAAGFAQFGPAAALADVAAEFGEAAVDPETVEQLALSGTVIGIGYAIIRLASLGSLAIAGSADRFGRRRVLLWSCGAGLVLTALTALSPAYWAFIAIFALGRPFLSATNAVAGVTAAEYTDTKNRASAIVLIAAGYGLGTGLTLVTRYLGDLGGGMGFRGLFGLALVPALLLPFAARRLKETTRFVQLPPEQRPAILGHVPRKRVPRLVLLGLLTAAIGFVTGPTNTYVFLYGEGLVGVSTGLLTLVGVTAGPLGLLGLLAGRWGADHLGRRLTSALAMMAAALGGVVLYSGPQWSLFAGYLLGLCGQAAYGPPAGALDAELFRTEYRATVAGWLTVCGVVGAAVGLLVFGMLWDNLGFAATAVFLFAPVAVLAWVYLLLPETLGRELDEEGDVAVDRDEDVR